MPEDYANFEEEPEELDEEQEETPEIDTHALLAKYHRARPGLDREHTWESFTDDERDALRSSLGITGPLTPTAEDEPEIMSLTKDELRRMDPTTRAEVMAEFEQKTREAEGVFNAGLQAVTRRELDASQSTLDKLADIRDRAQRAGGPNARSALLQEGAAIIERLRAAKSPGFNPSGQDTSKRIYVDPLTNRSMMTERDGLGNERTIELTQERNPELFTKPQAPDNFPEIVGPAEFVSWDHDKQRRFINEHPDRYETLLMHE